MPIALLELACLVIRLWVGPKLIPLSALPFINYRPIHIDAPFP